MVLAVWTTTDRHGEPCMSPCGTAKDESPEFVPLDEGSCEKIRPVGAPGLHQRCNPLQVIGGGVPSRRVLHKFRIFSQLQGEAALFAAGGQDENALSISPLFASQAGERT